MSRTNYSYTHHIYKDGYYQQGYPLGDAMGGDGQLIAGKVELITEDNQRWSTRWYTPRLTLRISRSTKHSLMRILERCTAGLERGCLSVGSSEYLTVVHQR
jgi:hypothetical protein